jgi:transaldolase
MPETGYFHEVARKTPTRFWINNPTIPEAEMAIAAGAVGCTTNPGYTAKMLTNPAEAAAVDELIRQACSVCAADDDAAGMVQQGMVRRLSALFMPRYEASGGADGYVTIQSDPLRETESAFIIEQGRAARKIAPNVMVKIPVTTAGIEAVQTLAAENCPVMATEVMGISQALNICGAYKKAAAESGHTPAFYVTHITGILDDYFKDVVKKNNLAIPADLLAQAGLSIAKKQYAVLKAGQWPGRMIGGGARKLADFTELVGGDLSITINWKGTADELIKSNPPVVSRIECQVDGAVVDRLKAGLPDYSRAYDEDGMRAPEFFEYGGVELFRNVFIKGWRELMVRIKQIRAANVGGSHEAAK